MKNQIKYKSGYKYQLSEDYKIKLNIYPGEYIRLDFIFLDLDGVLTIKKGYAWDGPSGPTIDTKSFMRGSLVHDALYQLLRNKKISQMCRNEADRTLRTICLEDGMLKFRAWYVYKIVCFFGGMASRCRVPVEIEVAP